ncbi:peroxisome biogenesis protein 12-like [Coffea arabica]
MPTEMCDYVGQPGMPRQPPNSQPNPFGSFFFAGLSFACQLLYLLDATRFYSLGLHVLGIHVCRATGQELVLILG